MQLDWERMYRDGSWSHLTGVAECPHHAVVAGYARKIVGAGRLLDAGCGEGGLLEYLDQAALDYVGFDLSPTAVDGARKRLARGRLTVCGFDEFAAAADSFDAIVFNESLQMHPAPLQLLDRFRAFLTARGVFIVSLFQDADLATAPGRLAAAALRQACDAGRYTLLELAEARNVRAQLLWRIFVLR